MGFPTLDAQRAYSSFQDPERPDPSLFDPDQDQAPPDALHAAD